MERRGSLSEISAIQPQNAISRLFFSRIVDSPKRKFRQEERYFYYVPLAALGAIDQIAAKQKIYRPSGLLTPLLHTGTVNTANAAKAVKNHDVVFSGDAGVFMNCTSLGINIMISVPPNYPTSPARLNDIFVV